MNIRWNTTPPRIEWKVKVGGKWKGRTVSLTARNLRRNGVPAPPTGRPLTEWHARRLVAVLAGEETQELETPSQALSLADMIDVYLSILRVSPGTLERRERAIRRRKARLISRRMTPSSSTGPRKRSSIPSRSTTMTVRAWAATCVASSRCSADSIRTDPPMTCYNRSAVKKRRNPIRRKSVGSVDSRPQQ